MRAGKPLERKTELRRKVPLTANQRVIARAVRLRKVSKTRAGHLDLWLHETRPAFLAAHPVCQRCKQAPTEHVHHLAGRVGVLLNDGGNLAALCSSCHREVHAHPAQAYEDGWLRHRNRGAA